MKQGVGLEELALVRNNFNSVSEEARILTIAAEYVTTGVASIPEPTTFALLGLSSMFLTARRKKILR